MSSSTPTTRELVSVFDMNSVQMKGGFSNFLFQLKNFTEIQQLLQKKKLIQKLIYQQLKKPITKKNILKLKNNT